MTTLVDLAATSQPHSPQSIPVRNPGFLHRYSRTYYQGVLLALLLCWSPSNALAYAAPLAMFGYFLLRTRSKRVLRNLVLLGLLWILWIVIHVPFVGDFAWSSALLSFFTFSAFIPILVIPRRFLSSQWLMPRLQYWVSTTVLIQASLGIAQAFYGFVQNGSFDIGNGDYVEGTIHPSLAVEAGTFSNPMFAVSLTFLLLFLVPSFLTQRKYLFVILLGLVALVLASVVHVLLFLGAATALVFTFYAPILLRRFSGWLFVVLAIAAMVLALTLLSANFAQVKGVLGQTTNTMTPRGLLLDEISSRMVDKYPYMLIFGLGQGQFSSRASLIGTGYYFGGLENPRPLPLVSQQISAPFATYALPVWLTMRGVQGMWGSTYQPFFSWLTLFTEFGMGACLLLFFFVGHLLLRIRRRGRNFREQATGIALSIGILFVVLLGFQENYWEVPQAIFPGLLLLKVMYAQFYEMTAAPYHPVERVLTQPSV